MLRFNEHMSYISVGMKFRNQCSFSIFCAVLLIVGGLVSCIDGCCGYSFRYFVQFCSLLVDWRPVLTVVVAIHFRYFVQFCSLLVDWRPVLTVGVAIQL